MNSEKQDVRESSPTDSELANYARAYIGAYLSAVQGEKPERMPAFAKNHPYAVEVCVMRNGSFCLLFDKAEKSSISVSRQDWDYVNGKVMSGINYLVTIYPHEGYRLKDAAARGKRDAIRDIRVLGSSDLGDAIMQMEKLLGELSDVAKWNKDPLVMAETAMTKLGSIKEGVRRAGPSVDMLQLVDSLKSYQPAPVAPAGPDPEMMKLIAEVAANLEGLGEVVKKVEGQDTKLVELENKLRSDLEDFKSAIDKKMARGLAVILTNADRKIDKAVGVIKPDLEGAQVEAEGVDTRVDELSGEIQSMKGQLQKLELLTIQSTKPQYPQELVDEIASIKDELNNAQASLSMMSKSEDMSDLVAEVETVKEQVEKTQSALMEVSRSTNLKDLAEDVELIKGQIKKTQSVLSEALSSVATKDVEDELTVVKDKLDGLQSELVTVAKTIQSSDLVDQVSAIEEELVKTKSVLAKLSESTQNQGLLDQMTAMSDRLEKTEEDLVSVSELTRSQNLGDEVSSLKAQLLEMQNTLSDSSREDKVSAVSDDMNRVNERIGRIESSLAEISADQKARPQGGAPTSTENLSNDIAKLSMRLKRVEDYLVLLSTKKSPR
jgi:predicted  nucleic acid-binding Zn-ribbon protein